MQKSTDSYHLLKLYFLYDESTEETVIETWIKKAVHATVRRTQKKCNHWQVNWQYISNLSKQRQKLK